MACLSASEFGKYLKDQAPGKDHSSGAAAGAHHSVEGDAGQDGPGGKLGKEHTGGGRLGQRIYAAEGRERRIRGGAAATIAVSEVLDSRVAKAPCSRRG